MESAEHKKILNKKKAELVQWMREQKEWSDMSIDLSVLKVNELRNMIKVSLSFSNHFYTQTNYVLGGMYQEKFTGESELAKSIREGQEETQEPAQMETDSQASQVHIFMIYGFIKSRLPTRYNILFYLLFLYFLSYVFR